VRIAFVKVRRAISIQVARWNTPKKEAPRATPPSSHPWKYPPSSTKQSVYSISLPLACRLYNRKYTPRCRRVTLGQLGTMSLPYSFLPFYSSRVPWWVVPFALDECDRQFLFFVLVFPTRNKQRATMRLPVWRVLVDRGPRQNIPSRSKRPTFSFLRRALDDFLANTFTRSKPQWFLLFLRDLHV
jgi:hypothetical protein